MRHPSPPPPPAPPRPRRPALARPLALALTLTLAASCAPLGGDREGGGEGDHAVGCACDDHEGAPRLDARGEALAVAGRWVIPQSVLSVAARSGVTITDAGRWNGESSCSGTFSEGARRLKAWVQSNWSQVTSIGGYSCRPINGNPNVTSIHAVGRALDIFIPLHGDAADNDLGDPVANYLVEHAQEIGVQRVIWDRTIWNGGASPETHEYTGAHPHHDHIHVEISVAASNLMTPFFEAGEPPLTQEACAPPLPAAGGVLDSDGPCLDLYGPARYWRSVGGEGHGGSLFWTNAFQSGSPSNWARWRFAVSAPGAYDVSIHSVASYSRFSRVRYLIRSADGDRALVMDPSGVSGWFSLGAARFAPGEEFSVEVYDNDPTQPTGSDQHIVVDALRLTPRN
ncbi:MAG: hypothetical protein FJ138_06550, partial [Deltaproteobacteria bacterium]|nr:hypothetical protein [Deltaproteobacteria bacterium]